MAELVAVSKVAVVVCVCYAMCEIFDTIVADLRVLVMCCGVWREDW